MRRGRRRVGPLRRSLPVASTVLVVFVGGAWAVLRLLPGPDAEPSAQVAGSVARDEAPRASTGPTPFEVVEGNGAGLVRAHDDRLPASVPAETGSRGEPDRQPAASAAPSSAIDIVAIGSEPWTNDGFEAMAAQLRADPGAVELLIEAFRSETDPARLERLAAILGEVGHPDLASIGSQMLAAGDPVSRDAGLALLKRIQPDDAQARETLIALLATENDPDVLASVIGAVSIPGQQVADERSGALVAQLIPLVNHPSAAVRRNGVTVLSRWADDATVAPVLQQALVDDDATVRDSAVYAFANQSRLDASVRQDLFSVLENAQESRSTRSGAALALQRADLDGEQARRLQAAKRQLAREL